MTGIVDKIKDKVRNRSRSRGLSISSDTRGNAVDDDVPKTPTLPSQYQNYPRTSLENSAFHVTSAGGLRKSLDNDPFQQRIADKNGFVGSPDGSRVDMQEQEARVGDAIPERGSSRYSTQSSPKSDLPKRRGSGVNGYTSPQTVSPKRADRGHIRVVSEDQDSNVRKPPILPGIASPNPNETSDGLVIPPRKDSLQSASAPITRNTASARDTESPLGSGSAQRDLKQSNLPDELAIRRKPVAQTQNDVRRKPSVMQHNDSESEKLKNAALASGHLILPEGFSLQNTERTYVTEEQRPAVTHETIVRHRTEVIQEAISRDIHVHHYYTYVQPIKVVEVLPAKHYFLDAATGKKTEVAAPAGWKMPASMLPSSQDYSKVKGWSRHYLVDEEHPNGVIEEASLPLKHEEGHENLRETAQDQQV